MGTLTYASPPVERMFGYPPNEMNGRNLSDFVTESDIPVKEVLKELAKGKVIEALELKIEKRDGVIASIESHCNPVYQGETIVGAQLIAKDVSKPKEAELVLQASQEILKLALESTNGGLWDWDLTTGEVFFNKLWAEMLGYRIEDIQPSISSWKKLIHPNDADRVVGLLNDHLDARSSYYESEHRFKSGSGEWIWVQSRGRAVDRDEHGKPLRMVGIDIDITKRKQLEQNLTENVAKYRAMFEHMSDGVAVYKALNNGDDFILLDLNRAAEQLDKIEKKEVINKSVLEKFPGIKDIGLFDVFQRVWKTGKGEQCPTFIYKGQRLTEWRENFVYKLPSGEIVVIYSDETERMQGEQEQKRLEAQLQQAQTMESIGTLAGAIAHSFNNILFSIMCYTELLEMKFRKDAADRKEVLEDLAEIRKASCQAKDLIDQILVYSRPKEQKFKRVQIHLIVKEVLNLLRLTIPATIEIRKDIDRCRTVLADPTQIYQVMINLCTNAAQAMQEKGGILEVALHNVNLEISPSEMSNAFNGNGNLEAGKNRFRISKSEVESLGLDKGPYVRLKVSDTGHGMERAVLDRIFDPYFTTENRDKGTAMGLSTVHGIVKNHDGAIMVRSEPGKGTEFDLLFPSVQHENHAHKTEKDESLPTRKERILFIDDEQSLADLGKKILERLGYEVTAKTSSSEALEVFRDQPERFDHVVMSCFRRN